MRETAAIVAMAIIMGLLVSCSDLAMAWAGHLPYWTHPVLAMLVVLAALALSYAANTRSGQTTDRQSQSDQA